MKKTKPVVLTNRCPFARYVPASPHNIGGYIDRSRVRLIVAHVAQGNNQSGIDAWFRNPNAKVSAHFSVSRFGIIHQHVDLDRIAWAEEDYNDVAWSIEHLGYSGKPLTRLARIQSLRLIKWLHLQAPQVPLKRIANPNGHGVIGHGELGIPGGDHPDCPGNPILAQINVELVALSRKK